MAEIRDGRDLATQPRLAVDIKPDIIRDHSADRVEIARVEMGDIGAEPRAIGVR
jgi:hypothetical protein